MTGKRAIVYLVLPNRKLNRLGVLDTLFHSLCCDSPWVEDHWPFFSDAFFTDLSHIFYVAKIKQGAPRFSWWEINDPDEGRMDVKIVLKGPTDLCIWKKNFFYSVFPESISKGEFVTCHSWPFLLNVRVKKRMYRN